MAKYIKLLLLVLLFCIYASKANAQVQQQFTGSNIISVGFESPEGIIEFASDNLQVRYLKQTGQLECRLPISTLYPLDITVPPGLAYEVMFGSKFPELIFYVEAPEEIVNGPLISEEAILTRALIEFQGTPNEARVPIMFASDKGVIIFSTSFDFRMSHFRATIPAKYLPLLSGRILIKVRNARWLNNPE